MLWRKCYSNHRQSAEGPWSFIIKLKLTAQLNVSIIMHETSAGTERLIKRRAIDVNRQR